MFNDGLPVFTVYSVFCYVVMWEVHMLVWNIFQLWYVLTDKNSFRIKLFTLGDRIEDSEVRLCITAGT